MSKETYQELKLVSSPDKFEIMLEAIYDLSKVSDDVMFRLNGQSLYLYVAEKVGDVLSLIKYYNFDSQELFEYLPKDLGDTDFVFIEAKTFYKQFKIYKRSKESIKLKILFLQKQGHAFKMTAWDGKIRNTVSSGDYDLIMDVPYNTLLDLRTSDQPIIDFTLTKEDYRDLKELAAVRTEDPRIFVSIKKNSVFIEENGTYSLKVAECGDDIEEETYCYSKAYFMSLPNSDDWKLTVLPTLLLMDFTNGGIVLTREL